MAIDPIRPTDDTARTLASELLRTARSGALATLEPDGCPSASLVLIATGMDGTPLILVSSLSAHTKNLRHDPRASLLLSRAGKGDPLACARERPEQRAGDRIDGAIRRPTKAADGRTGCDSDTGAHKGIEA